MFDKDDQEISQLIDASLEAVLSGKATLDQVLAEHPQQAAVLKREIEAATWMIARREQVSARPGFIASSRKRVIARIQQEAANTGTKRSIFGFVWPQKIAYQWVAALLALILLFSGAGGMVSYAQGAVPGEALYPVKLATERLQYSLTAGELERVEVSANLTDRRLQEVVALIQLGRQESLVQTIRTFEEQITRTVDLLKESSDQKPHEKKQLAFGLQAEFTEQAGKLEELKRQAPAAVQPELERAKALTELSASAAFEEAINTIDPTETPTSTPTPTSTATSTATGTATFTGTPVPAQPVSDNTDDVATDSDDDDPDDRKPTKTPRPTFTKHPLPSPANPDTRPEGKPPKIKPEKPDKEDTKLETEN